MCYLWHYWLVTIQFVQESTAQIKDHGVHLGRILDSVVRFRNQVRHHAVNRHAEDAVNRRAVDVNVQVGTQEDNPTCWIVDL
jgi:hypothetical protein